MKKYISFILVTLIVFTNLLSNSVYAAKQTSPFGDINYDLLVYKGYVVYGTPESLMPNNEYDSLTNEWRYLGYTADGVIFSNPDFPDDAFDATKQWHERDWIDYPWNNPNKMTDATDADTDPVGEGKYDSIQDISDKYGFTGNTHISDGITYNGTTLSDYLSLINPKTVLTPPLARGWHTVGGKTWYKTFVGYPETMFNRLDVKYLESGTNTKLAEMDTYILENGWHDIDSKTIENYTLVSWDYDSGVYTGSTSPAHVQTLFDGTVHELVFYYASESGSIALNMDINPNPSELVGGIATHAIELTAEAFLFGPEAPSEWILRYRPEGGTWTEQVFTTSNTTVTWNVTGLEITEDTNYYAEAVCDTNQSKTYNAAAEGTAFVTMPPSGDLNPDLYTECLNDPIDVFEADADAGIEQTSLLYLDGSDSTGDNEPFEYQFYLAQENMLEKEWTYFGWQSDPVLETEYAINPKYRNASDEVELDCRMMLKDANGYIKYAHDDLFIDLNIMRTPPETDTTGQDYYFPFEVTNVTGTDINRVTWEYYHPDGVPYDHSIVNVYKITGTTTTKVVSNLVQSEQYYDITGNEKEEFILEVRVVDTNGTGSDPAQEYCPIETAAPKLRLEIDDVDIETGTLYYTVFDDTPQKMLDHFPTIYTNWYVWDTSGDLLESGTGMIPSPQAIDARYEGESIIGLQQGTNSLNKTANAKDAIINGSELDFTLDPDQLFEGEYTNVVGNFKGLLTEPVWEIKSIYENDSSYQVFTFTDDKFTQPKGFYDVKASADGNYIVYQYDYDYSNDRIALMGDPIQPSNADVQAIYGPDYEYVWLSTEWTGAIESDEDGYYVESTKYNFRRLKKYMIITEGTMADVEQVEFLNGKASSDFDITGDTQYRTITLDGTKAIGLTDPALQAKYPIDFDSPDTKFIIEGKTDGLFDASLNALILGEGKVIEDGRVTFPAKQIQEVRFDAAIEYDAYYETDNGLNVSDPTSKTRTINADLLPIVDISVSSEVVYRDPADDLDATLMFIAIYGSSDDNVSLEKSYFDISYDANDNGDYADDGVFSGMKVYKDSNTVPNTFTAVPAFNNGVATVQLKTNAALKNFLGKVRADFVAVEEPVIPYLSVPGEDDPIVSADTTGVDDADKTVLIDNMRPTATLELGPIPTVDLEFFSHASVAASDVVDIQLILDQFAQDRIKCIIRYTRNGVTTEYDNFDQFDE